MMIIIAAFIGLGAGLANIFFRSTKDLIHHFIFEQAYGFFISEGDFWILCIPLIPMSGMLLLLPFSYLYPGEARGFGFTKFLSKVNLEGGRIKFRNIWLKVLATSLTIGTGGSAGVEGPIAQIGGAVGSQFGQFFRVSGDRMKVYIAAGCAGGIASIFNAPIAGVFFAAEIVLLGTYEISSFAVLVISSAIASVLTRVVYGETPTFLIPDYSVVNAFIETPLYLLMGLLIGVVAVLYIKVFYWMRDKWAEMPLNVFIKPLLGAFIVGSIGIFLPQVMGGGYEYITEALHGGGVIWIMFLLVFAKILATSITLGSGGVGGVFAPCLFIGAMIGGAFGGMANLFLGDHIASSGAYAAVGIGGFLAAATHAPLTSIFLLFEMTGNDMIIIPVMLTSIIGTFVAYRLCPDSIDTMDFSRRGIDIHEGRETAVLRSMKVEQIMTRDFGFISEKANVNYLLEVFSKTKDRFYFPVLAESGEQAGRMIGIISLQDVKTILHDEELRGSATVGNLCAREVIALTPEDDLYEAMSFFMMKGIEEIPVVESMEEKWVVGILKRGDVITAYNREVLKKGISEKTAAIRLK
ncbi:MAG: chloride channel protein [Desulfobia sp.]